MTKEELLHWSVYIKGLRFPVTKREITDNARGNNAPQSFMDELAKFTDRRYHTFADIGRELGRTARAAQ